MIRDFWGRLEHRQRNLVVFAAAGLIVCLILILVVFPLWDAATRMEKSIRTNTRRLAEMKRLDAELASADARISGIKSVIGSRQTEFSLFGFLDKKAVAAGVKGSIRHMNSVQGTRSSSFEESLIDLKLEKITIGQLTDFLYQVESPEAMILVKRITVDKMKESPDYLSAQMLIASYTPVAPGSGGR